VIGYQVTLPPSITTVITHLTSELACILNSATETFAVVRLLSSALTYPWRTIDVGMSDSRSVQPVMSEEANAMDETPSCSTEEAR